MYYVWMTPCSGGPGELLALNPKEIVAIGAQVTSTKSRTVF